MTPSVEDVPTTCSDIGLEEAVQIRRIQTDVFEFEVDGQTHRVRLVVTRDGEPLAFNWSSDFGMAAVVVRGTGEVHVYDYRDALDVAGVDAVFADDQLTAPFNERAGRFQPITAIAFCYETGGQAAVEGDAPDGVAPSDGGPAAGGAVLLAGLTAAGVVAVRRRS